MLLQHMDGRTTVRDLVLGSGANEADALRALSEMKESGLIEIARN